MIKEIFDRTLAAIGLLFAAPMIALLGLLIKLESAGPVFFKHLRVSKNGRHFRMYKFRKMPHDFNAGPAISPKYDPRLTKVGRVLERLKLDELPQLINILKGDMSFVGPRPEIPEIVRLYNAEQKKVLAVKPGLVGPNQIVWRNEKELLPGNLSDVETYYIEHILPQKLARDLRYVDERSFFLDLKYFLLALGVTLFEPLKPVHFIRRKREIFKLAIDLGLCALAFFAALLIKYDLNLSALLWRQSLGVLPILLFWQMVAFVFLGIYRQIWKYVGKEDLLMITKAALLATALAAAVVYPFGLARFPVSILILNAILCIVFLGGMRLLRSSFKPKLPAAKVRPQKNIMIYGANPEGELLLRRIRANLGPRGCPVGFLDGDPARRGGKIHGLEVMGNSYDLPLLKELYGIEEIYIAAPENCNGDLKHLLRLCDALQVKYQFVATTYSTEEIQLPHPAEGAYLEHSSSPRDKNKPSGRWFHKFLWSAQNMCRTLIGVIALAVLGAGAGAFAQEIPEQLRERIGASRYFLGKEDELLIPVNILGHVNKPGQFMVPNGTDLVSLIAYAGGLRENAKLYNIKIVRGLATNGQPNIFIVDLKKYFETGNRALIPQMMPDDTIIISGSKAVTLGTILDFAIKVAILAQTYYYLQAISK